MIAQVIIGNNTNIMSVKADIYKSADMTESVNSQPYLSKRISLRMVGAGGTIVQPNNEPVYVRLYYTEAEMDALMAASPGSTPASFAVVKTNGVDCGTGYSGTDAATMNTSFNPAGCAGENGYFEFFTGSFSTFVNYYRLRQVDLDGTETLSEVREVTISGASRLIAYPNPATDRIALKGFSGGTVSVVDMQGKTILRNTLPEFGSLDVSNLPAGVYLLRAGEESIRWVKQ